MSYTYLQEQGAESLAESFLDIPQFVLSRLSLTADESCSKDSETESCQNSQSGTTSKPLTENRGGGALISSAEDSHAKTLAAQGKAQVLERREADCGEKWRVSFAKWDRATCSWKTAHCLPLAGLDVFLETWPRWGMMRDGECWEQMPPDYRITEPECGWLATPLASDVRDRGDVDMPSIKRRFAIGKQVSLSALFKGAQCPTCAETIMAWPENWSAIEPLEMDKFHQWLRSHGEH